MALKNLNEQIERVDKALNNADRVPNSINVGKAKAEFLRLKHMLDGLTSFVEHHWMVKLYTTTYDDSSVEIKIEAEHLEEARDIAIELVDAFFEVIRFELYCDGILIPEHE